MSTIEAGRPRTIKTQIPSRLDRLPWARFHWMVIGGLGTAWILDGLEVTMVGSVSSRLTSGNSGIAMTVSDIGLAAAIYVIGACSGALFFGQLCDRFGRKRLFMLTLGIYIVSTVVTAFSFAPWFFFLARFLTGTGIGGEYSAINSAIDELIPARVRGRVDLVINGSYWFGSIAGSGAALFFLSSLFPTDIGWRFCFGVGAVLGLSVMLVRRNVPESPRWLFIHGREDEAEEIVRSIEAGIEADTGEKLKKTDKSITVRQRERVTFREIGRVAFKSYPTRSILCLALFVGQAFLYNGVTFNLGTLMTGFFAVSSGVVPVFLIIYAVGNFAGPLVLGRLFDTVGRKPMIAGTYIGSAVVSLVLALVFVAGVLNDVSFIAIVVVVFFLASAGASAAYLTASEIFPMETRALAIAFFYAIGTGVGGIIGPVLFGSLIATGHRGPVAIAFVVGAGVMLLGGIAEIAFGVRAAGRQLEDVAKPLTALGAEGEGEPHAGGGGEESGEDREGLEPEDPRSRAMSLRAGAAEERARAAEHRALAHEALAAAASGSTSGARPETEELLAGASEKIALSLDERAAALVELAEAAEASDDELARAARERAAAANERAAAHEEEAAALCSASDEEAAERHGELVQAAEERGRAREQRAMAAQLRSAREPQRAEAHELWAEAHNERSLTHELRATLDRTGEERAARSAEVFAERARAAEERAEALERREEAHEEEGRRESAAERAERRAEEEAFRSTLEERLRRERAGARRYRPGPGRISSSPGFGVTVPIEDRLLSGEISAIGRALEEHGPTDRQELARLVGARYWGPGVFREVLRQAVAEGAVVRSSRSSYGPAEKAS